MQSRKLLNRYHKPGILGLLALLLILVSPVTRGDCVDDCLAARAAAHQAADDAKALADTICDNNYQARRTVCDTNWKASIASCNTNLKVCTGIASAALVGGLVACIPATVAYGLCAAVVGAGYTAGLATCVGVAYSCQDKAGNLHTACRQNATTLLIACYENSLATANAAKAAADAEFSRCLDRCEAE